MKLLLAYRALAYITGVLLVLLVCVGVPLKYLAADGSGAQVFGDDITHLVGIAHGWLYMIYVIVSLLLSLRERWSIKMTVLVALAGTIPFASFVAENRVMARIKQKAAAPAGATAFS